MNLNPNYLSDRADRIVFGLWLFAFIASGAFIAWFGATHFSNDSTASAATKPPCPHNAALVGHNQPTKCDLTHGGVLIELGTSRLECANQGGRFVVVLDRRVCVGEDF